MNRADLVNAMANETAFSKKDVEKVLSSFINVVSNELENKLQPAPGSRKAQVPSCKWQYPSIIPQLYSFGPSPKPN